MNDFLASLKDDLTDRRLLPLVALAGLALAAALAYALLGGASTSTSTSVPATPPGARPASALPVTTAAVGVTGPLAETVNGSAAQRHGAARDPFRPLPVPPAPKAATVTRSVTTSTSSAGNSSAGSTSHGGSTPSSGSGASPSPKPAPAKPKKLYNVAVQFGPLPEGGAQSAQLQAYAGLSKPTPLPSAAAKLIEFVGVTVNGSSKSATFALVGEAILHGEASCHPSATQCRLITLAQGHNEQLEFLSATGTATVYELHVVSIEAVSASSAAVRSVLKAQSALAAEAGGPDGVLGAAGMRFSAQPGVIVFAGHSAFGAHAARRHGR